jgi:hypothetical protein
MFFEPRRVDQFGVRRQSEAATPLRIIKNFSSPTIQSAVEAGALQILKTS